jgi:hypothetical protein
MHILQIPSLLLILQFAYAFNVGLKQHSSKDLFATHAVAGGSFFAAKKGTKKPWGLPPLNPVGGHRLRSRTSLLPLYL